MQSEVLVMVMLYIIADLIELNVEVYHEVEFEMKTLLYQISPD